MGAIFTVIERNLGGVNMVWIQTNMARICNCKLLNDSSVENNLTRDYFIK